MGGDADQAQATPLARRVADLMSAALYAEDAEARGLRATVLLSDPDEAVRILGGPRPAPAARHAVIQRFGGVGALLVIACEELSMVASCSAGTRETRAWTRADPLLERLSFLLHGFVNLDAHELYELLETIDRTDGRRDGSEAACARRWLNVTYAIAERDRTDEAHHVYVKALDRVLDSTRALVAS